MQKTEEKKKESWEERVRRQVTESFAAVHGISVDNVTENLTVGLKRHRIQLIVQSQTGYVGIIYPEDTVQKLTKRIIHEESQ